MTTSIVNEDGTNVDDENQSYSTINGIGSTAFSFASVKIGNDYISG